MASFLPSKARVAPSILGALLGLAVAPQPGDSAPLGFTLPPGFAVSVYAQGLPAPRFMALSPHGDLTVSCPRAGKVVLLADRGHTGHPTLHPFKQGLNLPHGLAWHDGALYVAETDGVVKLVPTADGLAAAQTQVLNHDLPGGGMHWTRTLVFGPDGGMYVSVGSDCNACKEPDPRLAAILRFTPDGRSRSVYASGLRNSVGLAWAADGKLWATENGRDWLGDNLPPDELNEIGRGGDYGWPYAYGDRLPDPQHHRPAGIGNTRLPAFKFPAHVAPLGCAFYTGTAFPPPYRGDLFVCEHGSWNRSTPVGYKVVRVHFAHGRPVACYDFMTGFLRGGRAIARPVDVLVAPDGALLVSDDLGGHIYRVSHVG